MVAVAAEAVSRLLFFELTHEPKLLARLFVLFFEKGSAADTTAATRRDGGKGGADEAEEEEEEAEAGAKTVGGSVRLSQVRWSVFACRSGCARGVCRVHMDYPCVS